MELWQWLGEFHPKLVQFPLVLCLTGLLFDLAGVLRTSARARWAGFCLTLAGTVSLLFAFICGIYAEIEAGRAGIPQHPIELHELVANIAAWGFVLLLVWRILLMEKRAEPGQAMAPGGVPVGGRGMGLYVATGLVWYSLLLLAGYLGGKLVFDYGSGVSAMGTPVLSLSDLNTLANRQTDENLRYSEWMHHIFGWLTLGLAMSLILSVLQPKSAGRLRWIVPLFLLAGGIFLFFMADRDLYALSDPRQWRDREVQLHKSIATIMAVIGAVGLAKLRGAARASTSAARGSESAPDAADLPQNTARNSKLVAIMALIGGAMLFTHIHSVAPYANVAAGVYIFHIVLGLVALAIGSTRMLQEHVPAAVMGRGTHSVAAWKRTFAACFAFFMLIEACLLISYNEGLPWFIGYGTYNRWGPSENRAITVAPFGKFRALLFVEQNKGEVFVVFRDRYSEDSVSLSLDAAPQLLLAQGGGPALVLLLVKSIPEGTKLEDAGPAWTSSNFHAYADFLKTAAYLSPKLVLQYQGREQIGTFDPWVTPAITPVPPNEVARFVCPMHDAVKSEKAGACPLCGMEMIPIVPPRPEGMLADRNVDLRTTIDHQENRTATFTLEPMLLQNGLMQPATLALAHEQWMHLIMVSEDLGYFDHLHPRAVTTAAPLGPPAPSTMPMPINDSGAPSRFQLTYTFPRNGNYLLFADFTPKGMAAQAIRIPIAVEPNGIHQLVLPPLRQAKRQAGIAEGATQLISPIPFPASPYDQAAVDSAVPPGNPLPQMQVQLTTQPRTVYAGLHTQLVFHLADATGKPLTTIAPYLAAMGHCNVVSEDTAEFLHFHPESFRIPRADDRAGPDISFHAHFPAPGRYKVFAQFRTETPAGPTLLIAPFSIDVQPSPISPALINLLLNDRDE